MDLAVLRTEIQADPAGLGYAGKSDAQIADLLNALHGSLSCLVALDTIQAYLMTENVWWNIADAAKVAEHPAYEICRRVVDLFVVRYQNLDLNLPLVQQMGTGLVVADLLTAEQWADILAMGQRPASRAEILGLGTVSHVEVALALRG